MTTERVMTEFTTAARRLAGAATGALFALGAVMGAEPAQAQQNPVIVAPATPAAPTGVIVAQPATQQTPTCLLNPEITVFVDTFIPAYAVSRPGQNGPMIVINPDRGVGLGRETRGWLLERQCYLVASVGAQALLGPTGLYEYSPGEHEDADCAAYKRIVEANTGRGNTVRVIERDVSAPARGTYWDVGLGGFRPAAAADCR